MKKTLMILGLLLVGGLGVALYVYNKPHQNIKKAKADFQIEAADLFSEFEGNEVAANTKYLDKVIEVSGTVMTTSQENGSVSITLDAGDLIFGVICELDELTKHPKTDFEEGEAITLKGKCAGYTSDVVLVRCVQI